MISLHVLVERPVCGGMSILPQRNGQLSNLKNTFKEMCTCCQRVFVLTSRNSTSPSSPSSLMQSYSEPDCRNNCAKHISSLRNTIFRRSTTRLLASERARRDVCGQRHCRTSQNSTCAALNQLTSARGLITVPLFLAIVGVHAVRILLQFSASVGV